MAKATLRERVGSAIAYDVDWLAYGFPTVMRCGGTVELQTKQGKVFRITVVEQEMALEDDVLLRRESKVIAMPEDAE
jgi:hypothetical protein